MAASQPEPAPTSPPPSAAALSQPVEAPQAEASATATLPPADNAKPVAAQPANSREKLREYSPLDYLLGHDDAMEVRRGLTLPLLTSMAVGSLTGMGSALYVGRPILINMIIGSGRLTLASFIYFGTTNVLRVKRKEPELWHHSLAGGLLGSAFGFKRGPAFAAKAGLAFALTAPAAATLADTLWNFGDRSRTWWREARKKELVDLLQFPEWFPVQIKRKPVAPADGSGYQRTPFPYEKYGVSPPSATSSTPQASAAPPSEQKP